MAKPEHSANTKSLKLFKSQSQPKMHSDTHPKQEWKEPRLQQWCVRKVSEAELAATRLVLPEPHLNGAFSIGSNGSF